MGLKAYFGDTTRVKVIDYILKHENEIFSRADIAKALDVTWASIDNHLTAQIVDSLLKSEGSKGRKVNYSANKTSKPYKLIKSLSNFSQAVVMRGSDKEQVQ